MTRSFLFGTDGIRGTANTHPMTADIALKIGMSAGQQFLRGDHRHRVVIAKDTRLSGYMLEPALVAGFIAAGMDVVLVGPLPTPAVGMLVRSLRADFGVMISASHNPYQDNGIKLFGPDGYKLSDEIEQAIETRVAQNYFDALAKPDKLGRARRLDDAPGRYIEFAKSTFPKSLTLDGLKIIIDCANGAAYQVAPTILRELGAEVIAIGVEPNGFNINDGYGTTAPQKLCDSVVHEKANLGIALDGDADRVTLCDEQGNIANGDQLLAMIATHCHKSKTLRGSGVVATQMSNMGLERYLATLGLTLARVRIGDRYVVEHMRAHGFNIGGEQSGHIVLGDYATTGDGIIAGLQVLAYMLQDGRPLSRCGQLFAPLPQVLKNVPYTGLSPLSQPQVKRAIAEAEKDLAGKGRLLIRESGTEAMIRVMAEGENRPQIEALTEELTRVLGA
ncbi:MAG: phosphoglucosamine mutase [Pseudomonadota bacterium]|nr:phosphoglucosamine mutase [Pseudomonadota bacterium]MDE3037495.1 phosphoglucosamine mutase [Pseudomonadota bacterium]